MSNVKRKLKKRYKKRYIRPDVVSFCEDGCLVTVVKYNGGVSLTYIQGVDICGDDLHLIDQGIKKAFARLPWYGLDDLLKIVDFILDKGLSPCETTLIERLKAAIVNLCHGKNPLGFEIGSKVDSRVVFRFG